MSVHAVRTGEPGKEWWAPVELNVKCESGSESEVWSVKGSESEVWWNNKTPSLNPSMGKTRDLGLEKLETEYLEYETFSSRQSHLDILIYTHTSLPSANLARAIIFQVPRYRLNREYTSPHHIIHQYHSTTLHSISSGKFTSYIIRHSSSIIHHPLPIAHCPSSIVYRLSPTASHSHRLTTSTPTPPPPFNHFPYHRTLHQWPLPHSASFVQHHTWLSLRIDHHYLQESNPDLTSPRLLSTPPSLPWKQLYLGPLHISISTISEPTSGIQPSRLPNSQSRYQPCFFT